ncbi:hypothetical protein [Pseudomonas sp. B21-010]|uniref:hypothetical protein n=1 Tax=Pseudomonas sp. B21-010 TaxID=2895471 RepID=UPI00215E133F|nr:hypothetical protein [Pseudomonas sp. B21-010]UVM63444.1 hypothetical protein LOY50_10495 [Pseudomonas sp. B21-010]
MGTLAQRRFGVLHRQGSSKTGLIDPTTGRLESAHYRTPNLYDNTPYLAINFENQRPESLDPYRTAHPAHNQTPQYRPINTALKSLTAHPITLKNVLSLKKIKLYDVYQHRHLHDAPHKNNEWEKNQ